MSVLYGCQEQIGRLLICSKYINKKTHEQNELIGDSRDFHDLFMFINLLSPD